MLLLVKLEHLVIHLMVIKFIAVVYDFDHGAWILNLQGVEGIFLNKRCLMDGITHS